MAGAASASAPAPSEVRSSVGHVDTPTRDVQKALKALKRGKKRLRSRGRSLPDHLIAHLCFGVEQRARSRRRRRRWRRIHLIRTPRGVFRQSLGEGMGG